MTSAATILEIVRGSTKPFDIFIFDENEVAEDLSAADRAVVEIRKSIDGEIVLARDTTASNLSINTSLKKLTATMLGYEAATLPIGDFIGSAKIRFGDNDSWQDTDPFIVRILPSSSVAPVVYAQGFGIESAEAFGTATIVQS